MTPDERDILMIVDIQNDFCPGGALGVKGGDELVPIVNDLATRFRHVGLTQDWHPRGHLSFASSHPGRKPFEAIDVAYGKQTLWPDHCVQDTPGAAFHAGLHVPQAELVIRKGFDRAIDSYSALYENDHKTPTGLAGYLRERGLTHLWLAGIATDYCVAWSALDARREGFRVTMIEDACRAIDLEGSLARALAEMRQAGVTIIGRSQIS